MFGPPTQARSGVTGFSKLPENIFRVYRRLITGPKLLKRQIYLSEPYLGGWAAYPPVDESTMVRRVVSGPMVEREFKAALCCRPVGWGSHDPSSSRYGLQLCPCCMLCPCQTWISSNSLLHEVVRVDSEQPGADAATHRGQSAATLGGDVQSGGDDCVVLAQWLQPPEVQVRRKVAPTSYSDSGAGGSCNRHPVIAEASVDQDARQEEVRPTQAAAQKSAPPPATRAPRARVSLPEPLSVA